MRTLGDVIGRLANSATATACRSAGNGSAPACLAHTNKSLAGSSKSPDGVRATKGRRHRPALDRRRCTYPSNGRCSVISASRSAQCLASGSGRFSSAYSDEMKKTLLAGIAALFLATGAAHADNGKWQSDFRHCTVTKQFTHDPKDEFRPGVPSGMRMRFSFMKILPRQSLLTWKMYLNKKCSAFWQCVADRE